MLAGRSTAAAPAVESVFYPKAGHGFTTAGDRADLLRRVEAFLARHNPADSAVSSELREAGVFKASPSR